MCVLRVMCRYGTHYITGVVLGGRVELTASAQLCEALELFDRPDVVGALEVALAAGGEVEAVEALVGTYAELSRSTAVVGGSRATLEGQGLEAWAESVVESGGEVEVIGVRLAPITDAMSDTGARAFVGR